MTSTKIDHSEAAFETHIVAEMTGEAGRWLEGDPKAYDPERGLYPEDVVGFVVDTQPKKWDKLVKLAGGEPQASERLLKRAVEQIDRHGTVQVLRKGVTEHGVSISLCQLRPAHSIDERTEHDYEANRLRVVRQVRFDPKGGDSVDLVLLVNGLPTATAELKNLWTHQSVQHAIAQYRQDRDPRLTLLARRAFVHFAADSQLVYMTTRLDGAATRFLPFNQGSGGPGNPGGAGNPPEADGHPTSYLWRQVWDFDRWLELIQKFVHVEPPTAPEKRPTVIFPRYHQWDVVNDCAAHASVHGAGQSYLIQHSAGSGKTKEIAWLAHELSTLHDADDHKVFDKVVVITDRRVLDQQLQRQIAQFEQTRGVVESIEKDSAQLREALLGERARIVVTTLQKFPFVLKQLQEAGGELKDRSYGVIVDEAHSSQTGESATDLKAVLGSRSIEDLDLDPDEVDGVPDALLAQLAARGRQPNLSFFAFTATPKGKTLELFGDRAGAANPGAFHTYSMRQAIEEGFILDVLASYTTYDQFFRLEAKAEELELPRPEARSRIARFAKLHPYAKAQKASVIVDHYREHVRKLLGGEAKAMVVASGRLEAVRYKQALDRVISARGYDDVKVLVAFSGEVTITDAEAADHGESYTEPAMNAINGQSLREEKLPDEFDRPGYGVLVVAEKYQTGFDQPKLCAMYVDKTLTGVNTVQTLSRLNRTFPGKDTTFVLDFVNDAERVREAFEPFYERTEATPTEPNVLFDAADAVREPGLIEDEDLVEFARVYFTPSGPEDHAKLSRATQHAYAAALALEEDDLAGFVDALDRFTRLYSFLSQVVAYLPPETERLYVFARFLEARLRSDRPAGGLSIAGTVELTHYRLESHGDQELALAGGADPLTAIRGDGTGGRGPAEIQLGLLGELVEEFNERFGAELSDADAIRPLLHVVDKIAADPRLRDQALANDFDDFRRGKDGLVISAAIDVKEIDDQVLQQLLNDDRLRGRANDVILRAVYDQLVQPEATGGRG